MKARIAMALCVFFLIATLFPIKVLGNNTSTVARKAKLEALLEEYIACCEAKSKLRGSQSAKIRHSAMRSRMKAAYYRKSKAQLVEVMLENNIEPKAYKVRYFLNDRFHRSLQAME